MITKDSVTVYVNAIMYYKVFATIKPSQKPMQLNVISINQQVEDPVKAVIKQTNKANKQIKDKYKIKQTI